MTSPNPIGEGAREIAGKLTKAQRYAIRWLAENDGLEVPNMNMHGKAKEWPGVATLRALAARGLATHDQMTYSWRIALTPLGLAVRSLLASTQVTK